MASIQRTISKTHKKRYITLLITLNAALFISYSGLWFASLNQNLFWRADFTAFYTGWTMVRDGVQGDLYDLKLQIAYQQRVLADYPTQGGLLPYINPPHFALLFAPLAALSLAQAFYLWTIGQVGLLVGLGRGLIKLTSDWTGPERALLLVSSLAFPPLLFTSLRGTLSLLTLVILVEMYRALLNNHARKAGAWLALGAVKPQLMLMPALFLLGNRRWTTLISAGLLTILLMVISAAWLGLGSWFGFLGTVQTIDQSYGNLGVVPATMYNLKGTLTLWFGRDHAALIGLVSNLGFGLALLTTLWLGFQRYTPGSAHFDLRFALVMVISLFFNPHLNSHDGLLLVLPIVIIARYMHQRQQGWGWVALLPLVPIITLISEFSIGGALGIRFPTALMLGLMVWLTRELYRLGRVR